MHSQNKLFLCIMDLLWSHSVIKTITRKDELLFTKIFGSRNATHRVINVIIIVKTF